jgi:NAD(P)-dependent dehydrogenase (short-subunit alcohol dehydrogenase family)
VIVEQLLDPRLFADKTVFVTGGGTGINLAIAKSFAALGASIGICGRREERLRHAASELSRWGGRVSFTVADVRDYGAVERALSRSEQTLGPVDVIVCGAAGNFAARAEELTPNGFRSVMDIDLLGSFHAAHAAFPQLKLTRGSLIFLSATQAFAPQSFQVHAGAAKAGVDNLMRNLALEWGPLGIRSNSIAPGAVAGTEGMRRLAGMTHDDVWRQVVPLARMGSMDEVAGVAVVLASPLASYITGARIVVDGGFSLSGSGLFNSLLAQSGRPPHS